MPFANWDLRGLIPAMTDNKNKETKGIKMSKAKHTPIPWKFVAQREYIRAKIILPPARILPDQGREGSAPSNGPWEDGEDEANAAFIVEAVNNHDRLKADRDALLEALERVGCQAPACCDNECYVCSAIAKAKKSSE